MVLHNKKVAGVRPALMMGMAMATKTSKAKAAARFKGCPYKGEAAGCKPLQQRISLFTAGLKQPFEG